MVGHWGHCFAESNMHYFLSATHHAQDTGFGPLTRRLNHHKNSANSPINSGSNSAENVIHTQIIISFHQRVHLDSYDPATSPTDKS